MKIFEREDDYGYEFLLGSNATGVPQFVLKGFAALESNFNDKAYRYEKHIKDASYGLMQVLASTARGCGFKGQAERLYDPFANIVYGGRFIRRLASRYPRLPDLVAAYNMGFPRKISETTPFIARIYQYPIEYRKRAPEGWIYANEIYVRRTITYMLYYQARENHDDERAEEILNNIKRNYISVTYFKFGVPVVEWQEPILTPLYI